MMSVVPWDRLSDHGEWRDAPSALTVGVFDGVHIGHRAILAGITRPGEGLLPVVVTFSRHPQSVLDSTSNRKMLLSPGRKLAVLSALGIGVAVMIDFSAEFSKMAATSFFKSLAGAFRIRKVVEGDNFHFGRDREAGRKALAGLCDGIGARLATAEILTFKGLPVSSTRIRHAVQAGLMDDVREMLSGPYPLDFPAGAVTVDPTGAAVVEKKDLDQAVPDKGAYRCRTDAGAAADALIEKERIFIRTDPPVIKTLYFEGKIKPDVR